jgi:hypothetical protein
MRPPQDEAVMGEMTARGGRENVIYGEDYNAAAAWRLSEASLVDIFDCGQYDSEMHNA